MGYLAFTQALSIPTVAVCVSVRALRRAMRVTIFLRSSRCFSTSPRCLQKQTVDLAYTRHDPPSNTSQSRPPMVVMHGLFGSQRNNRTFSKYGAPRSLRMSYLNLSLRDLTTSLQGVSERTTSTSLHNRPSKSWRLSSRSNT